MSSFVRTHYWSPAACAAFVLDWDGVLAETKLSFAHIREKYFDGRFVPLFESIATLPKPIASALEKDIYDEEMKGAESAVAVPGAFDLLEWLDSAGIPWCVVSRNCMDSIRLAAERANLPLPQQVFSRDDPPVKPAPEALWRAAERMGSRASGCVMVGDFVYDLVGARRAGMRAVLVQRPAAEWSHWADASFDRLTDFVEYLKKPVPLLPWEYRNLRDRDGLDELAKCALSIPASSESLLAVSMDCAAKGVLNFHIEGEGSVTAEQWSRVPGLSSAWLDMPLREALGFLLESRYPLAGLLEDTSGYSMVAADPEARGATR